MHTQIGLWIDDPLRKVLQPSYWDSVVEHNVQVAALMIEDVGKGFDLSYKVDSLVLIRNMAFARDIELVLTTWPEPRRRYMEEFRQEIPKLLEASGASALEFDTEGNWKKNRVRGFKNLTSAGEHLVKMVKGISRESAVRLELTTYPYHVENSRAAELAPHVHRLLPQAYSVRNRSTGKVPWDTRFAPGGMQCLTLDRARQVGPKLSCGLAAYDQTWPKHSGEEAMRTAWEAAMKYNPLEIRFWSSKWVLGIRRNGYASRFLKSLKAEVGQS